MKKKLLVLLSVMVLLIGTFAMTGCGGSDEAATTDDASWTYIEEKGTLVVGLDDTFAPMGFRDEQNNLVGFDIDLANAVGEQLGVEVQFQPINWDSKELELESKNIDCIWNGMSATPERMESMSLSYKYLNNKIVVMTLDENVTVTTGEDMANYNIGTQADSAALETMKADPAYDSFAENITEYDTYDQALMDMQAGRVDCIVVDQVLGEYKNSKLQEKMIVCDYDFGDDYYAIGFRAGETELTNKVNDAIKALIDDGSAAEISNNWFGKDIVVFEPTYEE